MKFVPKESKSQRVIIGSGNGLAPDRCQAITWTYVDLFHKYLYVSPSLNELTCNGLLSYQCQAIT